MVVLNHIVRLNIVSALEVDRLVEMNVVVGNVRIKSQEKIHSHISMLVVNVVNPDAQKSTVNVSKMEKSVAPSVNVVIVAIMKDEINQNGFALITISPHLY